MMSAWVHGVVQSLTRTPRNWPAHPGLGECGGHPGAGRGLGVGRDGIFQIEEDLIGGKAFGLVDHLLAAARH